MYKSFSYVLITLCLILFNISCGLDTYVVMKDPISQIINIPEYNSMQYQDNYFEFWTSDDAEYPGGFQYLGIDIYYKIYNNYNTMTSERGYLENLASDSETAAKAPDKLINPTSSGGYDYKQLKATNINQTPLISPSKEKQRVYIRLTDYQNINEYAARILVDGENINSSDKPTLPVRAFDNLTFNFGRTGTKDKLPITTDEDVKYGTFTEDNKWYVVLFAVGVGRDVTYTNYYSNIIYLGTVPINDNTQNN